MENRNDVLVDFSFGICSCSTSHIVIAILRININWSSNATQQNVKYDNASPGRDTVDRVPLRQIVALTLG